MTRKSRKSHHYCVPAPPQSPNWLPWVVYATERGYTYKGDEYWPSFEEMTHMWEYKDRRRLAQWFRKFQKTYDGVVPCGRWAEQFTIISWPITHAILPQYLQDQLARMLYELRYRFVSMATREPADIGRLLADQRTPHLAPTSGVS